LPNIAQNYDICAVLSLIKKKDNAENKCRLYEFPPGFEANATEALHQEPVYIYAIVLCRTIF
jgi:hypothetical protein